MSSPTSMVGHVHVHPLVSATMIIAKHSGETARHGSALESPYGSSSWNCDVEVLELTAGTGPDVVDLVAANEDVDEDAAEVIDTVVVVEFVPLVSWVDSLEESASDVVTARLVEEWSPS